jgi:hypothetical protein
MFNVGRSMFDVRSVQGNLHPITNIPIFVHNLTKLARYVLIRVKISPDTLTGIETNFVISI